MLKKVLKVLVVLLIIQIILVVFSIESNVLPTPLMILNNIIKNYKILFHHGYYTLLVSLVGLTCSIILGILIAILMDYSKCVRKVIMPILYLIQLIPTIVLAPLFLIWFGFGPISTILVVIMMCIFPITINTFRGMCSVKKEYIELFDVIGTSKINYYSKLKIPFSLNYLFSGTKMSVTYSFTGTIFAEFMGAQQGLGVYLSNALKNFNTVTVFTIIVIAICITFSELRILNFFEKKIIKGETNEEINSNVGN